MDCRVNCQPAFRHFQSRPPLIIVEGMKQSFSVLARAILLGGLAGSWPGAVQGEVIDLRPLADATIPLANPDKGWYHHYPDNHINKYRIANDAELSEFPGMDHLYIRLAWAYLEPEEGKFNWAVIDDLIDHWRARGLGISFRISCKETSTDRPEQQFATPRWVKEAGAKGGHYVHGKPAGPEAPWEPAFDDPVFLEKQDRFLAVFAARYDGRPWLRYVDIGSLGDWGEGHTWAGSRLAYGYDARQKHVDLYRKHFRRSLIVASDDFVYEAGNPADRQRLHRYLLDQGISYRDDSILVNGYLAAHSPQSTVRSPELFADVWRQRPTVLELEHYSTVKKQGNWLGAPGSNVAKYGAGKTGPDYFRGALGLLRATYIGYHGYAAEWLADNPQLTLELLNRCGYWYFLRQAEMPAHLPKGKPLVLTLEWENRGVAPAYHSYDLLIRLAGPETVDLETPSGNQKWAPAETGKPYRESYSLELPGSLKAGEYELRLKLYSKAARRDVGLALRSNLKDEQGYYRVGKLKCD